MTSIIGKAAFALSLFAATAVQADSIGAGGVATGMNVQCNGATSASFVVPAGFSGKLYLHGGGGDNFAIFSVGSDGAGNIVSESLLAQSNMSNAWIYKASSSSPAWYIQGCNGSWSGNIQVFLVGATL